MSIEAAITAITEVTAELGDGEWMRLAEIKELTGLDQDILTLAVRELAMDAGFRATEEPVRHRITEADREAEVLLAGEHVHKIAWVG